MHLRNLIKVNKNDLGSLDDSIGILGRHSTTPLSNVVRGETNDWWWKSVSYEEAANPYYKAVVLFMSHVDYNNRINVANFLKVVNSKINNSKIEINATISGIMIGNILFLKTVSPTKKFDMKFDINTDNSVNISRLGVTINDCCFKGVFNLKLARFYYSPQTST
jgi:hypothetical protein